MKKICFFFVYFFCSLANAQSVGGITTGGVAYCDSLNSGFISLSNFVGTIMRWEESTNNGMVWIPIANSSQTQNYSQLAQTTWYRAIVQSGSFPVDSSTVSVVTIHQKAQGGVINGGGDYCLTAPAGTLVLSGFLGTVDHWEYSTNGGVNWTALSNTTSTMTHPGINQNTEFRSIVTNIPSCPSDTSTPCVFNIYQLTIPGNLITGDTICKGSNEDTLTLTGYSGRIMNWLTSTASPTNWYSIGMQDTTVLPYKNLVSSAWFKVVVKNGICPADTSSIASLIAVNAIIVDAGGDKEITRYESTTFDATGMGSVQWVPSDGLNDPFVLNPVVSPLSTTQYTITLTDQHSCKSQDYVTVNVEVKIPNVITPNGDGINDFFEIENIENFPYSSLIIFSRWGNQLYTESPYRNEWNGKTKSGHALPDDVYYYKLDYGAGEAPITGYLLIKK